MSDERARKRTRKGKGVDQREKKLTTHTALAIVKEETLEVPPIEDVFVPCVKRAYPLELPEDDMRPAYNWADDL